MELRTRREGFIDCDAENVGIETCWETWRTRRDVARIDSCTIESEGSYY